MYAQIDTPNLASSLNGTNNTGATLSLTIPSGYNRKIVVAVSADSHDNGDANVATTVSSCTFNGVTMTKYAEPSEAHDGQTQRCTLLYLDGTSVPVAGTYSIVVTMGGTCTALIVAALTMYNVVRGNPEVSTTVAQDLPSSGGGNNISASVTTISDIATVIDFTASQNNQTYSHGSGQIEVCNLTVGGDGASLTITYKNINPHGSVTMLEIPINAERQAMIVASFAYKAPPRGGLLNAFL